MITGESPDVPHHDALVGDSSSLAEEECYFGESDCRPSSRHRVVILQRGAPFASRILMARGGASCVHAHSAFIRDDICFVAVGAFACALQLPTLRVLWHIRADAATCFGLYDAPTYGSIISHGELEIARLSYSGQLVWSASGKDIFSEGFELHEHHAEAIDFDGTRYRFELETGRSQIVSA